MNVIDAYKAAKGKRIYRHGKYFLTGNGIVNLCEEMDHIELLADDWEVERTPLVWEGDFQFDDGVLLPVFPHYLPASVQMIFKGKRVKIRIEEIL